MFKNVYTAHSMHEVKSNCGEKERPNYKPKYLDNGAYELVQDGVFHSYEDIQAWLPTCDMGTIVERYLRTGDSSLLNKRAGFYADVTEMPKNYAELRNLLQDADNVFYSLPVELREQFGQSPAQFYSDTEKAKAALVSVGRFKAASSDQTGQSAEIPTTPPTTTVPDVVVEGGASVE